MKELEGIVKSLWLLENFLPTTTLCHLNFLILIGSEKRASRRKKTNKQVNTFHLDEEERGFEFSDTWVFLLDFDGYMSYSTASVNKKREI